MRSLLACSLLLLAGAAPAPSRDAVLIYSGTTGFRHDSIPHGIEAIKTIAGQRGLKVISSEDPTVFSADKLKHVRVIVLLSPTTDPKDPASEWLVGDRRDALRQFVEKGGGILAIHAAADSHYHWPWYGKLIGARFASHPPGTPRGAVSIANHDHPTMHGLGKAVTRTDEWYYFDDYDPRSTLLATLDPASIGEKDVNANPVAWTREVDGGRVFYTAMGHTKESYSEPWFRRHLANGLDWVMKKGPASRPGPSLG